MAFVGEAVDGGDVCEGGEIVFLGGDGEDIVLILKKLNRFSKTKNIYTCILALEDMRSQIFDINPLTAQNESDQSESDLFPARTSPSGFAAPYHFSL